MPKEVAHWRLNDNAASTTVVDASGNGHTGTAAQNTNLFSTTGKIGRALDFDGASDWVSVADDDALSFGDASDDSPFSVAVWIKPDDATTFRLFSKGTDAAREYYLLTMGTDHLDVRLFDNTSVVYIGQKSTATLTAYEGAWVHIVMTYDGSKSAAGIKFYVNGALFASSSDSTGSYTAMHNQAAGAAIGRLFTDGASYANGAIDDLRVYDVALTLDQIQRIYNSGQGSELPLDSLLAGGSGLGLGLSL